MNEAAFTEMTGALDEAIEIAEEAVKAADEAVPAPAPAAEPEKVKLVKVAAERYHATATALLKTGSFKDHTVESLANTLKNAGPAEFLGLMEKLASSAVFPFDADGVLDGDLVERSAINRGDDAPIEGATNTDVWADACREAGLNV